ncbi:Sulfite exporter TauE/SafE [Planctomycetes bacterium MalM25]|nr:Sulfite exporter TauE/SafE [Planctomycetes bacterium MalM25]
MAYLGGTIDLERAVLLVVLGGCLMAAGLRGVLRAPRSQRDAGEVHLGLAWVVGLPLGALLGGLSGLVGIGGGVFLAPTLYALGWGNAKQVASVCSAFILVNSVAALAGILLESRGTDIPWELGWLLAAVLVAGQVGSLLGSRPSSGPRLLTLVTSLLVSVLGVRCLFKGLFEAGVF